MERVTAVTALRSHGQKSLSRSNSSSNSGNEQNINDNSNSGGCISINENQNIENAGEMKERQEDEAVGLPTLTEQFAAYKKNVLGDALTGHEFSMENGVPELMALSDVMLLKPSQFNKYTRAHFTDQVLSEWHDNTRKSLLADVEEEASRIAKDLKKKRIRTREAVQKLVAMSIDKKDCEAQLLIGLSNLIQRLPSKTLLTTVTMGETELWSSVFDPIFSALLLDPDRNVSLRWTNVVPDDGSASEGRPLGYGEAKLADPSPNIDCLANDLLRLVVMNAKAVEKSKLCGVLGFQIHGYNLKVYITQKMPNSSFYTMTEFFGGTASNNKIEKLNEEIRIHHASTYRL
ncbi:hypothetical protein BDB00DRAFT_879399 [Zychaea mexicana]|uniref:uncharacterized protein n=1 Tax=Zychaea mexicana TaxID=64656 RepID=UPI0022FE92A8|nr:uncharacterized protein BDB00DRAFT_879399 [Zychaea mexicana]KAI9477696.1 hypothetical protein BDB00DRAFT_879399 [Zychaea mexicana]